MFLGRNLRPARGWIKMDLGILSNIVGLSTIHAILRYIVSIDGDFLYRVKKTVTCMI